METLVVVVPQHRNQSRSQIKSRGFKGMMNCRSSFDSAGILPSPPPAPQPRYRSSPISITNKQAAAPKLIRVARDDEDELWAGPAYTNSPPPSSLPIPNFSLREKRSVSLDLSSSSSSPPTAAHLRPVAKSAPSSPTRASTSPAGGGFFLSTAFATQDLRRILNLDI